MGLGRSHRALVLAALISVGLTGVVWFALRDVAGLAPDELQHAMLVAHGVAAFAALLAFGSVLPGHVLCGWRRRRNRSSGLATVLVMALLSVTALMLYYAGEEWQGGARLVHLAVGFAAIFAVPLHIVLGRRARRRECDRA